MKSSKKKRFIKEIREVPIITSVCKKVDITRQTYYRWLSKDPEFKSLVESAHEIGRDSINDLAESKLINQIADENIHAIKYWLSSNHRRYLRPRPQSLIDFFDGNNASNVDRIEVTIIKSKEDLEKESKEKP